MAEMGMEFQPDIGSASASNASGIKGMARRKMLEKVDAQKEVLSSHFEKFADTLSQAGEKLEGPEGKLVTRAAGAVKKAQDLINSKTTDELVDMSVKGLKEHPSALIAGAFFLGFVGARFLKS